MVTAAQIFFTSQTLVTYQTTDGQAVQRYTPMLLSATAPEEKRKIIGDTFVKVEREGEGEGRVVLFPNFYRGWGLRSGTLGNLNHDLGPLICTVCTN